MIGDYHGGGGALLLDTELRRESENKINLESRLAREDFAWSWADTTAASVAGTNPYGSRVRFRGRGRL